jgi:DNA-binding NtrC family response regulator
MTILHPSARALPGDAVLGTLSPETQAFVHLAARSDAPVLLLGETGSGKTHLARCIHALGVRARGPFQSVNCGAVPEPLFEREMFGHVRGAFTDARDTRPGLLEAAHGGTLLLDEVGEMPLALQPKLLAVLEDGVVRRLGSTHGTPVDLRIIAATNADLRALVQARAFRIDLYHRLAVLTHRLPPLRERVDEIPAMVAHLLARRSHPRPVPPVAPQTLRLLSTYSWPGNVRELDNALRHALAVTSGELRPEHLPAWVLEPPEHGTQAQALAAARSRYAAPASDRTEREMICRALAEEGGNRTRAARRLGMSRATLWIKLQKFGLAGAAVPVADQG